MPDEFTVFLEFSPSLDFFLRKGGEGATTRKQLSHATSVKDLVESCGVPHTEVGKIQINGTAVDFGYRMSPGDRVVVHEVDSASADGSGLQPPPVDNPVFIADEHLSKLVRRMRVLGLDALLFSGGDDSRLLKLMQHGKRTLLTRDRKLLMHNIVLSGYYVRSVDVFEQTCEVVKRYRLAEKIRPFTRCPSCNGKLEKADKASLLDRLEPKTRRYFQRFLVCSCCGKIFWRGSHTEKLEGFVEAVMQRSGYSEL